MTTKKVTATATYEKDTAKGKKKLTVEGGVVGGLYLPANVKLEDGAEFTVTLEPKS